MSLTFPDTSFLPGKKLTLLLLAGIVLFYLINGIVYLNYQTLTSDETDFFRYTIRFIKGNPDRIYPSDDNSKMPVNVLNTLPRLAEQLLNPGLQKNDGGYTDILYGRYVTLLFSVLTLLLVYRWASELHGSGAGLFAAFLFSICPNNLSHATLVTTDAYSVFFLLATMYWLWKFCLQETRKNFIYLSLFVALSQLVKQSLFHLYIMVPLAIGIYYGVKRKKVKIQPLLAAAVVFVLINLAVINAGFYFYQTGRSLGSYQFMSNLFQNVQQVFPQWLPIPFPHPFVQGLDQAKYYDQVGGGFPHSSFANVTILGQSRTGEGFFYYYFVSIFYKTPIPYFLFFLWSAYVLWKRKTSFWEKGFFLLLPVVYFLVQLSFFYKAQCGLRHLVFIYPFLFIFSSVIVRQLQSLPAKISFSILCLYTLVSVLSYWKNYYPYTNEFILDKTFAYKKVGADNLDFLHGGNFLRQYLAEHPEVKKLPKSFQKGTFVVSPGQYLNQWNLPEYEWIKNYQPIGNIARVYLLIQVK